MTSSADASEEAGGLRGQGSRQGNPLVADDIERRTVDQGPIGERQGGRACCCWLEQHAPSSWRRHAPAPWLRSCAAGAGKGPSKQPSMPAVPGAPEEAAETPPNVLVADAGDVEGQQPSWTGATGERCACIGGQAGRHTPGSARPASPTETSFSWLAVFPGRLAGF